MADKDEKYSLSLEVEEEDGLDFDLEMELGLATVFLSLLLWLPLSRATTMFVSFWQPCKDSLSLLSHTLFFISHIFLSHTLFFILHTFLSHTLFFIWYMLIGRQASIDLSPYTVLLCEPATLTEPVCVLTGGAAEDNQPPSAVQGDDQGGHAQDERGLWKGAEHSF